MNKLDDGDDFLSVSAGERGLPDVEAYRAIKMFVFDCDGVMTDARIILDSRGVEQKFFNVRDGAGMAFLRLADLKVAILTGRKSPVVDFRARELKIPPERIKQGAHIKLPVFHELLADNGLRPQEVAYMGDDIIDLPVLEIAGLACCPGDAHPLVKKASHLISGRAGGHGGIRAVVEHFMHRRADGSWEKALDRYLGRSS
jgi:3-deoxy-D-manno-octulosonate 8-phosphate phosphatase (KDO 8-P phosphatase)